jgi:hypothetical protein
MDAWKIMIKKRSHLKSSVPRILNNKNMLQMRHILTRNPTNIANMTRVIYAKYVIN